MAISIQKRIVVFLLILLFFLPGSIAFAKKESVDSCPVIEVVPPECVLSTQKIVQIRTKWSGSVVGVADGDTITVLTEDKKPIRIRLYGVDSPEKAQAFGQKAKQFVSDTCYMKEVTVLETDTDRYGRTVALIQLKSGHLLQEELLQNGFAWVYIAYCRQPYLNSFLALEEKARSAKKGLWIDKNPVPPWDFRKNERKK